MDQCALTFLLNSLGVIAYNYIMYMVTVSVQNLKKLGVYAGNDAIVAFARFHQVNIIIHQLSAKHLMVSLVSICSVRLVVSKCSVIM